jgi:hypothetical protein
MEGPWGPGLESLDDPTSDLGKRGLPQKAKSRESVDPCSVPPSQGGDGWDGRTGVIWVVPSAAGSDVRLSR